MSDRKKLLQLYDIFKEEIKTALKNFKEVPKQDYFYELCYCLLTPANKAQHCFFVVEYLKRQNFFEEGFDPTDVLRGRVFASLNPKIYIRFHNQKAKRLLKARDDWGRICSILDQNSDVYLKRDLLVQNVFGFGYKEASHFLRNIGFERIAILDRHILRNLQDFGLFGALPNISSRKSYLAVEAQFFDFARSIGIPGEELDLLFWAKETGFVLK